MSITQTIRRWFAPKIPPEHAARLRKMPPSAPLETDAQVAALMARVLRNAPNFSRPQEIVDAKPD